jgi:hypothetical protein
MSNIPHPPSVLPSLRVGGALSIAAAALLVACGGATDGSALQAQADAASASAIASATTTLVVDGLGTGLDAAALVARPAFHLAPVLLDEPGDADMADPAASAHRAPHTQAVPPEFAHLSTRGLTLQGLESARRLRALGVAAGSGEGAPGGAVAPLATSGTVTTYTPAQIRAAYGLPALPATFTSLSAAQAAQLGAGQTIYIVNAMHNPDVAAELSAFNQRFGLPACTTKAIASGATLPLAAASTTACELSVVHNTTSATLTSTAPRYDAGWATEIALDVQWAHATAPLARIVLIEAPDASLDGLLGGVKLANAMGPGVVSMSFGATEGNYTASVDAAFAGTGMSYLAATGDAGTEVSWPAVSPKVVAVGGTTLTWSGSGARAETGWSLTGGGMSAYTATPSYQTSAVPGMGSPARRMVADVGFNADPNSGQYIAVMTPGSATVNWTSAGGTSLSTPQWAGLLAVANAMRLQGGKTLLGAPHGLLYGQIGAVSGTYASVFADVTQGSDGSCGTCSAKTGYDQLTGLGTPNVTSLLTVLSGATIAPTPPVVAPATISGKVGTALTFTVSVSAPNPVTYTLSGAPAGMAIASTGVVSWPTPVAGNYSVTVTAKDSKTGLSGQGVYTVSIAAPAPPVVTSASVSGKVGTALSYTVAVSAPNPVTWTLTGAPSGMTISTAGVLAWASPVAGTYAVTVSAKDTKTALSGSGKITLTIAAAAAPAVGSASISGKVGTALSFGVTVSAPNPVTWTLSGAPSGMAISSTGVVSWASPVQGSYTVTVTAKDTKTSLSGTGTLTITIASATAAGPVITASAMNGVVGKPLTGTIGISAPGTTSLSVSISGAPLGMSFSMSGTNLAVSWASPVAGSYGLKVSVTDSSGRTTQATVPVTIAAK